MRIAGVIAEYDPFHAGHAWQLARLRQLGAEYIVVCMSGPVVQRGTAALFPVRARAAAALAAGADLVLALPAPWAALSAEGFAAGGVAVLSALGCVDTLAFGAEHPDAGHRSAAAALQSPGFAAALRQALAGGAPFAAARAAAAEAVLPGAGALLAGPNDNLGVEYCKAILRQGSPLTPLALPRQGAQHGDAAPKTPQAGFASAGFLRAEYRRAGLDALAGWVPQEALALYRQAGAAGEMLNEAAFSLAVLARLRGMDAGQLARIRGAGEGLDRRLAAALRTAGSLQQLYAGMKTRRYAHARLRRLALDAALGYTGALPALPPYLHLLAARRQALPLCKSARLPCGCSLAGLARQNEAAAAVAAAEAAAWDLTALCRQTPGPMGLCYTQKPVIL